MDRCNQTMQRWHWLDIARRLQQQLGGPPLRLAALCLQLPPEVCAARAAQRTGHAPLPPEQASGVIQRFVEEWQWPQPSEGFHAIYTARSSEEAASLAAALLGQPAPTAPAAVEPAVPAVQGQQWQGQQQWAQPQQQWGQLQQQQWGQGQQAWQPQQQRAQPQQQWGGQAFPPGLQQSPQPGWQQQQQRSFSSRADAVDTWRRGDSPAEQRSLPRSPWRGSEGKHLSPVRAPSPERDGSAGWGLQQQQQQPSSSGPGGNIVAFPGRQQEQQQGQQQAAAPTVDRAAPRKHPWQRHAPDQPSGRWYDAPAGCAKVPVFLDTLRELLGGGGWEDSAESDLPAHHRSALPGGAQVSRAPPPCRPPAGHPAV